MEMENGMSGVNEAKSSLDSSTEGLKINLEQMQLNELQKISSQLQTQRISGTINTGTIGPNPMQTSFSGVTINGRPAGGVISSQPMQNNGFMYNSQSYGYTPPAYTPNIIGQAINMGAMALSNVSTPESKETISSTLKEMRENNQTFFERMFDKISNNPLVKYASIDYGRTSDKGVEAIGEQAQFAVQRAGLDVAQAGASIAGGTLGAKAGDVVGSAIGTAIFPGVGTVVGKVLGNIAGYSAGSAIGSGSVGLVKGEIQDRQDYSTWLQENAYKFINSTETNNSKVNSGFTGSERKELSRWLANMNIDYNMTDDEINTILQGVTDAGLLKSASDMESFKKKFSSLVSTIKEGAKIMNLSYEEMTEMLADLNKEGIKSDADRELILNDLKAKSDLTGMDVSTLYDSSENLKSMLYGGTSADPTLSLQNSTTWTTLGSTAMDEISKQMSGENKEAAQQTYGTLYNYMLNEGLSGDQVGTRVAQLASNYLDPNSQIGASMLPFYAYAANYENGVVTGFDSAKIQELNSYFEKGDLNGAQKLFNQWQAQDENASSIVNELSSKSGQQLLGMFSNSLGTNGALDFINNSIDAFAYSDNLISKDEIGQSTGAAKLFNHYGMGAENGAVLYQFGEFANSQTGQAVMSNIDENNQKNEIRRNSASNEPVGFMQGLANKWEGLKQNVTDKISGFFNTNQIADFASDFITGQDTAMRLGYGSSGYNAETYKEVYDSLSNSADLFQKAGLGAEDYTVSDHTNDKIRTTLFGNDVQLKKAKSSGESTKKMKKKIEKSGLSEDEKEQLLSELEQSEGQTQSSVAGFLDIVQDIGGNDYRKSFIKDFDLKGYGFGMDIDDLANSKKIEKLTLDQQKQIQDELPKLVAEQLSRDYNNKDLMKKFGEMYSTDGLKNSEIYANAIKDNKLDTNEIEQMLVEIQKTAYTGSDGSSNNITDTLTKELGGYVSENGEQLNQINSNLKSNNDSTQKTIDLLKENNEKQEKVNEQLQNQVKQLQQRITALSK